MGKTKVFMKESIRKDLEIMLSESIKKQVICI